MILMYINECVYIYTYNVYYIMYIICIYKCTFNFMVQLKIKEDSLIKIRDTHQIHGDTMIFSHVHIVLLGSKYVWPLPVTTTISGPLSWRDVETPRKQRCFILRGSKKMISYSLIIPNMDRTIKNNQVIHPSEIRLFLTRRLFGFLSVYLH